MNDMTSNPDILNSNTPNCSLKGSHVFEYESLGATNQSSSVRNTFKVPVLRAIHRQIVAKSRLICLGVRHLPAMHSIGFNSLN